MNRPFRSLPALIVAAAVAAFAVHGPIAQYADYHRFADERTWLGVPNALDVLSNLGFALVGVYGLARLAPRRRDPSLRDGWPGYSLFLVALILTALGSAFYHLSPGDGRLVWDRVPIALACAGLLAGVRARLDPNVDGTRLAVSLALLGVASVLWWYLTALDGAGDLRAYLLLQALPLVLIPLWHWIYRAPRAERAAFTVAIALYIAAKAAEILDHELYAKLHAVSGHTLKHLLATAASAVIVITLVRQLEPCAMRRGPSAGEPDPVSRSESTHAVTSPCTAPKGEQ